jgi:hypothetical protein
MPQDVTAGPSTGLGTTSRPTPNRACPGIKPPLFKKAVFDRGCPLFWPKSRAPCPRVQTSASRFLPCVISWVFSTVRIDASTRLTVYSGCACDGGGLGGERLSCWSSRPRSAVGIVKGSPPAAPSGPYRLKPPGSFTLLRMPRSPDAVLTARLALITGLADDLACANGSETPDTRALADAIKREVEAVRRALNRQPIDLTTT